MKDRITLIGCPKLDAVDYAEKLIQIFRHNQIRSVTVTRMTVPCCGGLSHAVKRAIETCGKDIPLKIVMISPEGVVKEQS
jgi:riboflavin synthase